MLFDKVTIIGVGLLGGSLGDRRVGVYYWDGPHDYDGQLRGMHAIEPWLAPEALILIDDYDWEAVSAATQDFIADEERVELLVEIAGEEGNQVWWWDGVAVLAWRARRQAVVHREVLNCRSTDAARAGVERDPQRAVA